MSKTNVFVDWDINQVIVTEVPASPPRPADGVVGIKIAGKQSLEGIRMKFTALFMQVLLLTIVAARDAFGNVLDINALGTVLWDTSDPTVATIVSNQDGSVTLQPTGKAGVVQVTAKGDTDPNTPQGFVGFLEVTFLPGEVVAIDLSATPVSPAPVDPAPVDPAPVA